MASVRATAQLRKDIFRPMACEATRCENHPCERTPARQGTFWRNKLQVTTSLTGTPNQGELEWKVYWWGGTNTEG